MVFCTYLLSKKKRRALACTFTTLNLVQISLGLLITIWSIYICIVMAPKIYMEGSDINFVFTVTGMFGTHIIIHFAIGIKVCEKCMFKAHKLVVNLFVITLKIFVNCLLTSLPKMHFQEEHSTSPTLLVLMRL